MTIVSVFIRLGMHKRKGTHLHATSRNLIPDTGKIQTDPICLHSMWYEEIFL